MTTSGSCSSLKRKLLAVILTAFSLLFLGRATMTVSAALTVVATASPPTINLGQNETITVSWNGGTAGASYTFRVTVTKPGGTGTAFALLSRTANSTGGGNVAAVYPQPTASWTTVSGTLNTDFEGSYTVTVDKTAPNPVQTGVATTSFTVTHVISVVIVSPIPSSSFIRGDTVTITASLTDANGQVVTQGSATATTPQSTLSLPQTTPGIYTAQYQVQRGDPLGGWGLNVTGTLVGGNYGSRSISVTILPAQLIITGLATYNSQGNPTADFYPGDSLYARFRIAYSSSGFLRQGTFNIQVRNPSGATITSILAIYDSSTDQFLTPSGFQVTAVDPDGSWQLVFPTNSLNDTYGNTGPTTQVAYRFQVHTANNSASGLNLFYFGIIALALGGGLSGAVVLRRFNEKTVPFDQLFKLTGGEIQPQASLMIIGDAGAGTTTLGLQLLYRTLAAGKHCGLLSYDAFPSEVKRKMRDMGWDITPFLEKGQLVILDVYSSLAGVEGSTIKDPTDFTEVSIQVTSMIEKAKGPITILMDSVTPIFNSAPAKDCINFLQVIAAKVKNSGGTFIFTATKGSIPEDARMTIESLADGVIELSLVKKAKSLARYLMVKKISGRQISSTETKFQISTGKGIVLVKQRIPISILPRK